MREQLFQFVSDAHKRTLELVSDLADEQLIVPKMEIANPFRWELGRVATASAFYPFPGYIVDYPTGSTRLPGSVTGRS